MTDPMRAGGMPVSAIIADTVARIRPDATLLDVADALVAEGVGALIVGFGAPTGIVSERDLVGAIAARRPLDASPPAEVASTELVWCDATATVAEVAEEMSERYVRHVLVQEDGRLVGIVSARDMLRADASADPELEL